MPSVDYPECHKQAHNAERRYAECLYEECRGAVVMLGVLAPR